MAFVVPYDADEAIYEIVARDVVQGHWPYEHLFINRQPLTFLAYLPAGLTGSIELQRLGAAAAMVASVPPFFALAQKWLSGRQVTLAMLSYCVLIGNPFMITGANVEAFLLLPIVAAMVVPSAVLAGVLIGAALMLKLTVLPLVPAILFLRRTGLPVTMTAAIVVGAAAVIPFVPVWSEFWTANVTFSFDYADYSAPDRLANAVPIHWGVLLGALPVWVAAAAGGFRERRWTLWVLLLGAILAAKSTGFNFGHYYAFLAPPAGLFAGLGLDQLLRRPRMARALMAPALLISLAALIAGSIFAVHDHRPYADLVAEIDKRPGELYVLGGHPEIYVFADRQPKRRYFFSVPLVFRESWGKITLKDLVSCPPGLLVLPTNNEFQVDWVQEVAGVYQKRLEFDNASLLVDPDPPCPAATGE